MVTFVVLDGNIGSGKSTILMKLKEYGWKVEEQPVNEWTFLESFYNDPKKFAMILQIQVINSYNKIYEKYKDDKTNRIVFLESFGLSSLNTFAEMLFEDGILDETEIFNLELMLQKFEIRKLFFINVEIFDCLRRIKERNRKGEELITFDYLEKLRNKYEKFLNNYKNEFKIHYIKNDYCSDKNKNGNDCVTELISKLFTFSIEGNIGSGKTTNGGKLCNEKYQFLEQLITDELSWYLEMRYTETNENLKRWILNVQLAMINMYISQKEKINYKKIPVYEGILSVIDVFTKASADILDTWVSKIENCYLQCELPTIDDIDLIIYLCPPLDIRKENITERKRIGEENIENDYYLKLDELYEKLLFKNEKVIRIENPRLLNSNDFNELIQKNIDKIYKF